MCESECRARSRGYPLPRRNRCPVRAPTGSALHLRRVLVSAHSASWRTRRARCPPPWCSHARAPSAGSWTRQLQACCPCPSRSIPHCRGRATHPVGASGRGSCGSGQLRIKQLCCNSGPCGFWWRRAGLARADRAECSLTREVLPGLLAIFSAPRVRTNSRVPGHSRPEVAACVPGVVKGSGHLGPQPAPSRPLEDTLSPSSLLRALSRVSYLKVLMVSQGLIPMGKVSGVTLGIFP